MNRNPERDLCEMPLCVEIVATLLPGRRPERILAGGDSHRIPVTPMIRPGGAEEDITSHVHAIPPPRRGGFPFNSLPVVSPPANFLMALRAMKSLSRFWKNRLSQ